jgi:hypothetical protein
MGGCSINLYLSRERNRIAGGDKNPTAFPEE